MRYAQILLCTGVLAVVACSSEIGATNPYDPETSLELQAKGTAKGTVVGEAGFDPATLKVTVTGVSFKGSPIATTDATLKAAASGVEFSFQGPGGTYAFAVNVPGFEPVEVRGVTVAAGVEKDLGLITLRAGRGSIQGKLVAKKADGTTVAAPADTRVSLLRLVTKLEGGATGEGCKEPGTEDSVAARLRSDGRFEAVGLAAGPYLVLAERDGYVPAFAPTSIDVAAGTVGDAGELTLLSAEGMLKLERTADPDADVASSATRSLQLVVKPGDVPLYNAMRISEDPAFSDAKLGDTEFRLRATSVNWTLAEGADGARTLHVQFRAPTCTLSPVFTATAVVDTTPPVPDAPAFSAGRACSREQTTTVQIRGADPCEGIACAGLYQVRLAKEDALEAASWTPFESSKQFDFGGDGVHDLAVQLKDRAGNKSDPAVARLRVNTTGPVPGNPSVVIDGGNTVRSVRVRLRLDVEGAQEVEVGNAEGLTGRGFVPLPATGELDWRLEDGDDGDRRIYVRFRDDCGNVTPEKDFLLQLDRTSRLRGGVRLEGDPADLAGTTVALEIADGAGWKTAGTPANTATDGSWSSDGLAAGTYRLTIRHAGFVTRVVDGVVLPESTDLPVAELSLVASRGSITGLAKLQGETSHDGIIVTAGGAFALTDTLGRYTIRDLKTGQYLVRAEKGAAYSPVTSGSLVAVEENKTLEVPTLTLAPVPGKLSGTAVRGGKTVHGGIDVTARGITVGGSVQTKSTTTADDGSWEIAELTSGSWSITFAASGFRTQRLEGVLVGPASDTELERVSLAPATGSIAGKMLLAGATSSAGVRVSASQSGIETTAGVTDSSGVFLLRDIPSGEYTVTATITGYSTRKVTAVVVEPDLVTQLPTATLARQLGEVSIKDVVDATPNTTVQVVGSYPAVVAARLCEDPTKAAAADFAVSACPYQNLTFTGGGTTFDPVSVAFKAGPCTGTTAAVCDGQKTVWVRLKDGDGAESDWFELRVVLDRKAPKGNIVIEPGEGTLSGGAVVDGGAAYTRTTSVRVLLSAADDRTGTAANGVVSGVVTARLYRSVTDQNPVIVSMGDGAKYLEGFSLASGADGSRSVIVQFLDGAGNKSIATPSAATCPDPRGTAVPTGCDAIFVDSTPPAAVRFSVNPLDDTGDLSQGSEFAVSPLVRLGVDTTMSGKQEDEGVEATLANDASFTAAIVQPLGQPRTVLSWFLSNGDGTKSVFVRVRDRAGNLSNVFQDTITLDTATPDAPALSPVGAFTTNRRPALSFGGSTGADSYLVQLSDSATFASGSTLIEKSVTATTTAPTSDLAEGSWFWRVRARDRAGHESAWSPVDAFKLDLTPPAAPTLAAVLTPSANRTPTLTWTTVSDAASYVVEIDSQSGFGSGAKKTGTPVEARFTAPILSPDGTWFARVQAKDSAGNLGAFSTPVSFVIDTTAPSNPVLSAPADGAVLATGSVTLEWDAASGASSYAVQVSSSSTMTSLEETLVSGTQKTLSFGDGSWTFRVAAIDAAGNRSDVTSAAKRTFTVDTIAPGTPALTGLAAVIQTRTPTFVWSSQASSGATKYTLTVDSRTYDTANTTLTPTDSLVDGRHSWTVVAVDAAGNVSPAANSQAFDVDATAPPVPVLAAVPTPAPNKRPTFSWSGSTDAKTYSVEWDRQNTFDSAQKGTASVAATSVAPGADLADGTWFVRVRAVDAASNQSAFSTPGSFVVDTAAPLDPDLSAPSQNQLVASTSFKFTWNAISDAASYRLELSTGSDFSAAQVETGITQTNRTVTLADAPYRARVLAIDAAGNASAGASVRLFTVDTVAPNVPTTTAITSPTKAQKPTFAWSNESGSGATGYQLQIDGVVQSISGTSFTPSSNLADGTHTFAVASRDAAGNTSALSATRTFELDSVAPDRPSLVAVTPDPTAATTQELRFAQVAGGVSYRVEWDKDSNFNSAALQVATTTTDRVSATSLSEGKWFWRVRATDAAGNDSAFSVNDDFTIDVTPPANPAQSSPADNAVIATSAVTLQWNALSETVTYLLDVSTAVGFTTFERTELTATSRTLSLPDGNRFWRVVARDAAGNLSNASSAAPIRKVTVDTVAPLPPTLSSISTPTKIRRPGFGWAAVSDAVDYSLVIDGVAANVSGTSFTPSSDLTDGQHTWTVSSRDAAGNRGSNAPTETFAIDSTPPSAPTLTAYTPDPGADNTPTVSWGAVATAAAYTVEWDTLPGFNSGSAQSATASGTTITLGPLANGTWYWHVKASDALGNASSYSGADDFIVDVTAPSAPTLSLPASSPTLTNAVVGFAWSTVSDAVSYRLQIASDSSFGTIRNDIDAISGTTRNVTLTDGAYFFRVFATDAAGNQTAASSANSRGFSVDATQPATPVLGAVVTPTKVARPTFTWSDESSTGATSYILTIDTTDNAVSATTFQPSSNLGDGSHTVKVAAKDAAGNVSSATSAVTFVVDTGVPAAPGNLSPALNTVSATTSVAFGWDAVSDAAAYAIQVSRTNDFASTVTNETPTTNAYTAAFGDGDYFWRVASRDAAGNQSAWAPGNNGRRFSVDTIAPNPPVVNPVGALVKASPTLSWTSSAGTGATSYEVVVDNDSGFGSVDLTTTPSGTTQSTSLADGQWFWRVRAKDASSNTSAWSSVDTFTIDSQPPGAPTSPLPSGNVKTKSSDVGVAWSAPASGGAASYHLQVAYDSAFTTLAFDIYQSAKLATRTLQDGKYWWRVYAVDAAGNESTTAAGGTWIIVDTDPPRRPQTTSGPTWIGIAASTYTLNWSDESDSGASEYRYQVATDDQFSNVTTEAQITATTVTLPKPTAGTYWWRVRSYDDLGNASVNKFGGTFIVDLVAPTQPSLSSPSAAALVNSGVVNFAWTATTEANPAGYEFQVGAEPTFQNQLVVSLTTQATASSQALAEGAYFWRVRAIDLAGNSSKAWTVPPWSSTDARGFTVDVTPPNAPSFTSNPVATNDQTPNLGWNAVPTATTYEVVVDDDADFSSPAKTLTVSATSLSDGAFGGNLGESARYYAVVRAIDAAGNRSAPSGTIAFAVDVTAPAAPARCDLLPYAQYLPGNVIATDAPSISWTSVSDAVSYDIEKRELQSGSYVTVKTFNVTSPGSTVYTLPSTDVLTSNRLTRLALRSRDAAGNVTAASSALLCRSYFNGSTVTLTDFKLDNTAPSSAPNIVSTSPAGSPAASTTFAVTWDKIQDAPNGGEMGYLVNLYDGTGTVQYDKAQIDWGAPFSAGTRTQSFDLPGDAAYLIEIAAFDAARNLGPAARTSVFIADNIAPAPPLLSSPLGRPGVSSFRLGTTTPEFSWLSELPSGATSYALQIFTSNASAKFGSQVGSDQTGITDTTVTLSSALPSADAYFMWKIRSIDAAGNSSAPSVKGVGGLSPWFFLDVTAPAPPTLTVPTAGATVAASGNVFKATRTVPSAGETLTYTLQVWDESPTPALAYTTTCATESTLPCSVSGSTISIDLRNVTFPAGNYFWRMRATDDVGNVGQWTGDQNSPPTTASLRAFTVDATPPRAPNPTSGSYVGTCTPTLSWTDESGSGAASYRLWVQQLLSGTYTAVSGLSPKLVSGATTVSTSAALGGSCDGGSFRYWLESVDAVGNTSVGGPVATFVADTSAPNAPVLQSVDARNRSGRVFWTGVTDTSLIQQYDVYCDKVTTGVMVVCATVDGTATEAVALGLTNKRTVSFNVKATNGAGLVSNASNTLSVPVGWRRTTVPVTSAYPIQPMAIAARDDEVYVTYSERDYEWLYPTGNLRVAVSTDNAQTWKTRDVDTTFGWARGVGPIVFTSSGVVIATSGSDQSMETLPVSATGGQVRIYRSTNQGDSWSGRYFMTATPMSAWAQADGIGLWTNGPRVFATWITDGTDQIFGSESDDSGSTFDTSPDLYYDTGAASGLTGLRACSADYSQFNTWVSNSKLVASVHYYPNDPTFDPASGEGIVTDLYVGGTVPKKPAIACSSLPEAAGAYVTYLVGANLMLNRRGPNISGWTGATTLRTDADVDNAPAIWAGGKNVYIVYRTSGDKLMLGESVNQGGAFVWSELDVAKTGGYFPVVTGTGTSDLYVAFTDAEGAIMTVLRPALRGVDARPIPGIDQAFLTWSAASDVDRYQVDHSSNGAAPWTSSFTSLTGYTVAASPEHHLVRSLDEYAQPGNDTEVWRVAPFVASPVFTSPATTTGTNGSRDTQVVANGDLNVIVLPAPNMRESGRLQTALYRSTNGGASFTPTDVSSSAIRAMAATGGEVTLTTREADGTGKFDVKNTYFKSFTDTVPTTSTPATFDTCVTAAVGDDDNCGEFIAAGADMTGASNNVLVAWSDLDLDQIAFAWAASGGPTYTVRGTRITIPGAASYTITDLRVGRVQNNRATIFWTQKQDSSGNVLIYYAETTDGGLSWGTSMQMYNGVSTITEADPQGHVAASGNAAFGIQIHNTGTDNVGVGSTLRLTVTGTDYTTTSVTGAFTKMTFDAEQPSTQNLDAVSTQFGHYIAYRTNKPPKDLFSAPEYCKVEFAYCGVDCHVMTNWARRTLLRWDTDTQLNATNLALGVSDTGRLYITYRDVSGTTNTLKILRGGVVERRR